MALKIKAIEHLPMAKISVIEFEESIESVPKELFCKAKKVRCVLKSQGVLGGGQTSRKGINTRSSFVYHREMEVLQAGDLLNAS